MYIAGFRHAQAHFVMRLQRARKGKLPQKKKPKKPADGEVVAKSALLTVVAPDAGPCLSDVPAFVLPVLRWQLRRCPLIAFLIRVPSCICTLQ